MNHFKTVKFVNLSVSALGVFDQESSPFIELLKKLNVDNNHQNYKHRCKINVLHLLLSRQRMVESGFDDNLN